MVHAGGHPRKRDMAIVTGGRAGHVPARLGGRNGAIVATVAGYGRAFKNTSQMTGCALHDLVLTGQWKPRIEMVKPLLNRILFINALGNLGHTCYRPEQAQQ